MNTAFLAILILSSFSTFAGTVETPDSCTDGLYHRLYPSNFIVRTDCKGAATDAANGKQSEVLLQLNKGYDETENSVFNPHYAKFTSKVFGLWNRTRNFGHLNLNRNCVRAEDKVRCTGIGVGTGEHEFEVVIDLKTMKAEGFYLLGQGTLQRRYDFSNLNCGPAQDK